MYVDRGTSERPAPRRRPLRRPGRRAGFNILELAIALALLTVAAAVAIPLFYGRASVTLDNAAILLARDLRSAQNAAVFRQKDVVVQFLPDGDGYRLYDEFGVMLPNPTGGGDFRRQYSQDGVFEGVELEFVETGPNRSVTFTPEGLAPYALEVHLLYDDERRELAMEGTTGLVTIKGLRRHWQDDGH